MHVRDIEFAGFFKTFMIFADFFPCHATINIAEVRFEPMPYATKDLTPTQDHLGLLEKRGKPSIMIWKDGNLPYQ